MYKHNIFFLLTVLIVFCSINSLGQANHIEWKEEEKIYAKVYNASIFGDKLNDNAKLYQITNKKPTILALIFTRCAGVCNPFLLQLKENLQMENGENKFNVVVISFDPRDTKDDMNLYAKKLGLAENKKWFFVVTDSISILNKSIGFNPLWDSVRQQYDHDALLVGINTEGIITKKLIGLRDKHELSQLINSINNVFAPSYQLPNQNKLFSCFNYDAKTGENKPGLGLLFIALPGGVTIMLVFSINYFVRVDRN